MCTVHTYTRLVSPIVIVVSGFFCLPFERPLIDCCQHIQCLIATIHAHWKLCKLFFVKQDEKKPSFPKCLFHPQSKVVRDGERDKSCDKRKSIDGKRGSESSLMLLFFSLDYFFVRSSSFQLVGSADLAGNRWEKCLQ